MPVFPSQKYIYTTILVLDRCLQLTDWLRACQAEIAGRTTIMITITITLSSFNVPPKNSCGYLSLRIVMLMLSTIPSLPIVASTARFVTICDRTVYGLHEHGFKSRRTEAPTAVILAWTDMRMLQLQRVP